MGKDDRWKPCRVEIVEVFEQETWSGEKVLGRGRTWNTEKSRKREGRKENER